MRQPLPSHFIKPLAIAAALVCATAAHAADAESRARAHIADSPARSLHAFGHSYTLRHATVAHDGAEHVRFDRQYRGLRVVGGDLIVHSEAGGALRAITHTLRGAIDVSTRASVRADDAVAAALASHAGEARALPELIVYTRGDAAVLAYDVRVDALRADDTPSEMHVIVDANSGSVLEAWDDIQTAPATGTGNTLHSGDVPLSTNSTFLGYQLLDPTRGGNSTRDLRNRTSGSGRHFSDADNNYGDNTNADRATAGADAHYGVTLTWDYFKNVHGRNGIRDDGVGALSRVHYSTNYVNAFWSDSCFCMTYGDGNGSSIRPLTSIDVAGHEMTHGVTSATAGLIYSGESGGLNEATSDIFGAMVEYYAANASDPGDYLIGEKLFVNGTSVIRNMIRPSVDNVSADCWYPGVGNIDVHYSSGIANHFFFLLAEGTTAGVPSPTCTGSNTRVATGAGSLTGIGRSKAEKIWFVALTQFMTTSTNYAAARVATVNAATQLYGAGSAEAVAVQAAWTAVQVN